VVLVIGIGNPTRCDDGVGAYAAGRLAELGLPGVTVRALSGEGTALMDAWSSSDCVFAIDATHSGRPPGTVQRFDASLLPVPADRFHYSTHAFSLAQAVELSRVLGSLPARLIIYGIEGATFAAGTGLSDAVRQAAEKVVEQIRGEIQASSSQAGGR
jgi:hydrogenase maturation protease